MGYRVYLCQVESGTVPVRSAALEAVFKPVQPPTTFEETVERLGTAIRLGLLPPGSRLPAERELAEPLRISRSTLRHALNTLVQSGHLVALRGRAGGTFVADEPPLVPAIRGTPSATAPARCWTTAWRWRREPRCWPASERPRRTFAARRSCTDRMAGEAPFEEYRRADVHFHIGVAEAAHSPRLVTAMTEVQGQMSDLIARIAHPDEVLERSNAQHRRIAS